MKKSFLTLLLVFNIVFSYSETPFEKIIKKCSTFEIPFSFTGKSITISFSEKDLIEVCDANLLIAPEWKLRSPIYGGAGPRYIHTDGSMQECSVYYIDSIIGQGNERHKRTVFAKYKEYENFYLILIFYEGDVSYAYADLYSFSKSGEIISSIPILESDLLYIFPEYGIYEFNYNPLEFTYEYELFIISSKAYEDKFVTTEIRFDRTMKMTYQLLDNGYFKLIDRELDYCEFEEGYIDDSDGYVNVREEPNVKSTVLFTLKDKTKVVYYPLEESNWSIIIKYIDENGKKINCNGGYVYKSRIKHIEKKYD